MKLCLSIFVLVISQITVSTSSELRNAMLSVEDSFGKLLTDVVTDVRDTITCTIMAIEHAFINDRFNDNSDYYTKCGGPTPNAPSKAHSQPQVVTPPSSQKRIVNDNISQQIKSSLSTVNNFLENHGAHTQFETVRSAINKETSRLADVTRILKQELDKMSDDIRKRFKKFKFDEKDPSIENVWESIKILHKIEQGNKNSPEVKEVSQVIDKVLDVLDIKEDPKKTENDKIEDVINTLVQNSSETSQVTEIKNELIEWKREDKPNIPDTVKSVTVNVESNSLGSNNSSEFPRSFKDVVKKINDETKLIVNSIPTVTENSNMLSNLDKTTRAPEVMPLSTTQKPGAPKTDHADKSPDYDFFFPFSSNNKNEHRKAVRQANQIIEDSKRSQIILDNFFKRSNNNAKNVFDNPNLLNFR